MSRPPINAATTASRDGGRLTVSWPAIAAASAAPSTMPKFITEVTSAKTLACSTSEMLFWLQNSLVAGFQPSRVASLALQRVNPQVTPQGRPASSRVKVFSSARAMPPATNDQGP